MSSQLRLLFGLCIVFCVLSSCRGANAAPQASWPKGFYVDWWATRLLPLEKQLPAEAQPILQRMQENPTQYGRVVRSPRATVLLIWQDAELNPGMELITSRRKHIIGHLKVFEIRHEQVTAVICVDFYGIAVGDLVMRREEYAVPAPQVRWLPVNKADHYHLWRRKHGTKTWREIYVGKDTAYADPDLLPGLETNTCYQYRVGADIKGACYRNPHVLSTLPVAPPPVLLPLINAKASPWAPSSRPALETLMSSAVAPLTAALNRSKTDIEREWLLHALAATRDPKAIEPLAKAFKDYAHLREEIGKELSRFGPAGVQRLANLTGKE